MLSMYQKTKALVSSEVTMRLICAFVFVYVKIMFSHDADQIKDIFASSGTNT